MFLPVLNLNCTTHRLHRDAITCFIPPLQYTSFTHRCCYLFYISTAIHIFYTQMLLPILYLHCNTHLLHTDAITCFITPLKYKSFKHRGYYLFYTSTAIHIFYTHMLLPVLYLHCNTHRLHTDAITCFIPPLQYTSFTQRCHYLFYTSTAVQNVYTQMLLPVVYLHCNTHRFHTYVIICFIPPLQYTSSTHICYYLFYSSTAVHIVYTHMLLPVL